MEVTSHYIETVLTYPDRRTIYAYLTAIFLAIIMKDDSWFHDFKRRMLWMPFIEAIVRYLIPTSPSE